MSLSTLQGLGSPTLREGTIHEGGAAVSCQCWYSQEKERVGEAGSPSLIVPSVPTDLQFLVTFFSRLRPNHSGRYEASFPFLSLCGRERNFLRCEDRPVVFTHLLASDSESPRLSYCGGGEALAIPFEPARLLPLAANGRLYHPAPERAGGVGLVRSALAFELSACFEYGPSSPTVPSHVHWQGRRIALTMDLAPLLPAAPPP